MKKYKKGKGYARFAADMPKEEKELILKWINQSKHQITLRDWLLRVAYDWQNGRAYELELQGPINLKEFINK